MPMRICFVLLALAMTNQVIAHPSLMPHDHPHAVSHLAGLDALAVALLVAAAGWSLWRLTREK